MAKLPETQTCTQITTLRREQIVVSRIFQKKLTSDKSKKVISKFGIFKKYNLTIDPLTTYSGMT